MRDINCVENYFNLFDKLIGIDKLDLIHFNDSSKEYSITLSHPFLVNTAV